MDATWVHALVAGVAAAVPLLIYMAKFNQKVVEQIAELKSDHKHLDKCFHRLEGSMNKYMGENKESIRRLHEKIDNLNKVK